MIHREPRALTQRSWSLRAAPWVLGAITVVLSVGLASLGILNRQSVERAARQAFEGRALELGLGTAAALLLSKPRSRADLEEAIRDLTEAPVSSLAVLGARGVVLGSSRPGERGTRLEGSQALLELQRGGALHRVERLSGGARPTFRVWILLRPGLRRHFRSWRRGAWQGRGPAEGMALAFDDPVPGTGEGRGLADASPGWTGRGAGRGLGREAGRGPDGSPLFGEGRRGGEGPLLGRAFLRLEVEIDDPPIAAAVSRARGVQVVTLSASAVLLLFGLIAFLGDRRAQRMRRRLGEQQRLAEMGEMAAVLAHEIRNPLGVIKGYAQLLREQTDGPQAETLDRVVGETGRLERLVNGLLDFARPATPRLQEVALDELCTRACELASDEAQRRDVRFVLDLQPLRLVADPDGILQALLNLVRNAVQASSPGGPVTVRCGRQGASVVVSVLDAGEGLPAALGDDIFKPFVTTRAGGTGLGLAVSRRIAELHGGTLTARPGEDRGTVFTLRLPAGRGRGEAS